MNPLDLPVHPIVVHFPIALLVLAWGCTMLRYLSGAILWTSRARTFERIGVTILPITVAAGFIDTRGISFLRDRRWDQPLIWHMIVALITTVIFFAHFVWSRQLTAGGTIRTAAIDLSLMSAGLWGLLLSGSIAAEMVYGA